MIELSPELRAATAIVAALGATFIFVPVAILLATKAELYDRPRGWKTHARPTPYLGGAAVLVAAAVAIAIADPGRWPVTIVAATIVLAILGTLDDVVRLHAWPRLIAEAGAGASVSVAGLGWKTSGVDAIDLFLTIGWVVAVINALNLLDLMDGVASASVCATAIAVAGFAAINGNTGLLVASVAMSGACLGFLRFNLAKGGAKIFLGDGGTMPIGFLVAIGIISALSGEPGRLALPAAALLFGVPLFDMAFRTILRLRRGIPLMTPGPDSLTNSAANRLGTPRRVAMAVAVAQGVAGGAALGAAELGDYWEMAVWGALLVPAALCAWYLTIRAHPPILGKQGRRILDPLVGE